MFAISYWVVHQEKDQAIMVQNIKLWVGLGIAASLVAGAQAHAGQTTLHAGNGKILLAQNSGEGGEGGEGESGGGDGLNDAIFLSQLALIEGHMLVGAELYKAGEAEMAKTHMKHPRDEIYESLESTLAIRKSPDFAVALDAVGKAVTAGAPAEEVARLHAAFAEAIHKARPQSLEAATAANAAIALIRTAAEEYEEGVKDGKIVELHEYQDAWGFMHVAAQILASLSDEERNEHKVEIGNMETELGKLGKLWPDVAGKMPVNGSAKELFTAAARMELAALDIK
jgi:hypothetical protein